jgi:hypothetical protein
MKQRMKNDPLDLYNQYFVERDFERWGLFELIRAKYGTKSALYPGSFVHITPSFIFPITTYVDRDSNAKRFFRDPRVREMIAARKTYSQRAQVTFHPADYREDFGEPNQRYDLLISQYAGFVSQHCKRYLQVGGVLVANNSHGDASMAFIDEDYELTAVVQHTKYKYRLITENLNTYFVPKKRVHLTREYLEQKQRGIPYVKSAEAYLFVRVK